MFSGLVYKEQNNFFFNQTFRPCEVSQATNPNLSKDGQMQHHSVTTGLTKGTKAISVTEKVVHLQNHISPVLPLCAGPILSTAGQSRIRRFVDTELNRWHPQCRQTGRQAKRFTSLCISAGQHAHLHERAGTHSSKWLHSMYAFCPDCDVSSGGGEKQWDSDMKKHNVSLAAHAV